MKLVNSQRVAILVDSENLEISVANNYEPAASQRRTHVAYPDWKEIIPGVLLGRTLVRNIYYKKKGKHISDKFKRLWQADLGGEFKQPQKSVDPYIIVDAITLAQKADTVILLAGDKDYLPLIWFLRSQGCKVEMASFEDAAADVIKQAADKFHLLGDRHTISVKKSSVD